MSREAGKPGGGEEWGQGSGPHRSQLPPPRTPTRSQHAAFADLPRWLRLHDLLAGLDPEGEPAARALPAGWAPPARLGVLAGSFNPLNINGPDAGQKRCLV